MSAEKILHIAQSAIQTTRRSRRRRRARRRSCRRSARSPSTPTRAAPRSACWSSLAATACRSPAARRRTSPRPGREPGSGRGGCGHAERVGVCAESANAYWGIRSQVLSLAAYPLSASLLACSRSHGTGSGRASLAYRESRRSLYHMSGSSSDRMWRIVVHV